MKTAKLIKSDLDDFCGNASLYEVDPPIEKNKYVIASSVIVPFSGEETYLFPAYKNGKVKSWGELNGSQEGTMSHTMVFEEIGYTTIV
jgi:hypothetical protein